MALVEVFKSNRKSETYLYLPRGCEQDTLPEALRQVFGKPEYVLGLDLTPDRQLARFTGAEVLAAIEEQGFFLQLPESDADEDAAC
ncbi:MAG: YcgL domain-containing protein [Halieaceae bacterium]|jgi:uncharacterized protein YcgL (UPF0745 family)|nr:YcgL domain-containing protein [Halieaceae bacterium]